MAIYKRGRGVELGAIEKQMQLTVLARLEPGTSGFQVSNHSTTPPTYIHVSGNRNGHFRGTLQQIWQQTLIPCYCRFNNGCLALNMVSQGQST